MTEAEAQSEQISKSARKRANKKAREAAEAAAESEPPAPAPKAAAKASSKAKAAAAPPPAEPEPKASAKAKPTAKATSKAGAKAKATAKAEPVPAPPAEPEPKAAAKAKPTAKPASKAKAKGAAKAEPTPPPPAEPEPKAAAKAKPTAKPASKAASKKAAAKPAPPPAPVEEPKEEEKDPWLVEDDGTGGDWEVASAVPKKQQQRMQRKQEMKVAEKTVGQKRVPGATFVDQSVIKGPAVSQAVGNAVASAATKDAQEKAAPEPAAPSNRTVREITVPEAKMGLIIGPKGAKLLSIQAETETTVNVEGDQALTANGVKMRTITVAGEKDNVARALGAIEDLATKGYTSLGVKGFEEAILWVHPSGFPELIGSKGAVINAIKEKLKGVDISMPDHAPKDPTTKSAKKYKVAIAGPSELVKEAQEVVNSLLMYHHHEITHPGEAHEEVELPDWAYGYVIGPKGSEMRHIQKNFNVRMYLPRDHSPNQNCVIVGENKAAAERAKTYVEKLIWNAENQGTKRDKVDNGDVWGEEEDEPWMAQYMYKR